MLFRDFLSFFAIFVEGIIYLFVTFEIVYKKLKIFSKSFISLFFFVNEKLRNSVQCEFLESSVVYQVNDSAHKQRGTISFPRHRSTSAGEVAEI